MDLSADQSRRVSDLFDEAMKQPASDRRDWVDRQLATPEVKEKVLAWISNATVSHEEDVTADGPPLFDGYHTLEQIGRGGGGEVWLAQDKVLGNKCAIKLLSTSNNSTDAVQRFRSEGKVLAAFESDFVVKVVRQLQASDGRPALVMEYVKGQPITTFCDRQQLSIVKRLELFVLLCRGVVHCHERGVVHRDLKPENVLVTGSDFGPMPKIIDFGICKPLAGHRADGPVYTRQGASFGTLLYMSPEQARGETVGKASDLYSLGVILHELVAGIRPYSKYEGAGNGEDKLREAISNRVPDDAVTQLKRSSFKAKKRYEIAEARGTTFEGLCRQLTVLQPVLEKAISKDPGSRFATAEEFKNEIKESIRKLDDPRVAASRSDGESSSGARVATVLGDPEQTDAELEGDGHDEFETITDEAPVGDAVSEFERHKVAAEGDDGDPNAQFELGECYYYGKGTAARRDIAVYWYRKAAERGHSDAQWSLGHCAERGEGISQNPNEAIKWYRKAAKQGNAEGQWRLGWMYERGHGVETDLHQAVKWYRKAAEQGNAEGRRALARMERNGYGAEKDRKQARTPYREAGSLSKESGFFWLIKLIDVLSSSACVYGLWWLGLRIKFDVPMWHFGVSTAMAYVAYAWILVGVLVIIFRELEENSGIGYNLALSLIISVVLIPIFFYIPAWGLLWLASWIYSL